MPIHEMTRKHELAAAAARKAEADKEFKAVREEVKDNWEKGECTAAYWALVEIAEEHDTHLLHMAVQVFESLTKARQGEVLEFLGQHEFQRSIQTVQALGEQCRPVMGRLTEYQYSQQPPPMKQMGRGVWVEDREDPRWMREKDMETRMYRKALKQKTPTPMMEIGADVERSMNDTFGSMFPEEEEKEEGAITTFPSIVDNELCPHEDEQRLRALLWAITQTSETHETQMSQLIAQLASISPSAPQSAQIKKVRAIIDQEYLASLFDGLREIDTLQGALTVVGTPSHLRETAYTRLKAMMPREQRLRLIQHNTSLRSRGNQRGRGVTTLQGLLGWLKLDMAGMRELKKRPAETDNEDSGSINHVDEEDERSSPGAPSSQGERKKMRFGEKVQQLDRAQQERVRAAQAREQAADNQGARKQREEAVRQDNWPTRQAGTRMVSAERVEELCALRVARALEHQAQKAELQQLKQTTEQLQRQCAAMPQSASRAETEQLIINAIQRVQQTPPQGGGQAVSSGSMHPQRRQPDGQSPPFKPAICRDFQWGSCSRQRCRFNHAAPGAQGGGSNQGGWNSQGGGSNQRGRSGQGGRNN